jgi:hypothetical protein
MNSSSCKSPLEIDVVRGENQLNEQILAVIQF